MNVKELIEKLQQFDLQAEVVGTWEGVIAEVDVYRAADGHIVIDVDSNYYKEHWQNHENKIVFIARNYDL